MESIINKTLIDITLDNSITAIESRILCYLVNEFQVQNSFKIKLSNSKISKDLNISYPTVMKAINSINTLGYIDLEAIKGRSGGSEFTLTFLKNNFTSLPQNTIDKTGSIALDIGKNRAELESLKYKEFLESSPEKYKDSLQLTTETLNNFYNIVKDSNASSDYNIKNFYTQALLTIKDFDIKNGIFADIERNFIFNPLKYKVSLEFTSSSNLMNINSLEQKVKEFSPKIKRFFGKFALYIPSSYIRLLIYIDYLLYSEQIVSLLEKMIDLKDAENGTTSKKENFILNEKSAHLLPKRLLSLDGFIEAYNKWLTYKKVEKSEPVTKFTALEELKFLSLQPDPISAINFSIRKSAKNIIVEQNKFAEPKETSKFTNSVESVKGKVKIL